MANGEMTIRPNPGQDDALIADDELIDIARAAEGRVKAIKTIIKHALSVTSEKDWVSQNNRPYLQGEGAEAVANMFGVSWSFIEKPYRIDEDAGHFRYECVVSVKFRNRVIEVMGTRSSKDPFFSVRYLWDDNQKKKVKSQLPPEQIDAGDVMKACITNAIGNGVTRILGIRNATWEMLKDAGLNVDAIQKDRKVEYGSGTPESDETTEHRQKIRDMILEMCEGDQGLAKKMLQEATSFIPKGKTEAERVAGKTSVDQLSEKMVQVTYGQVCKVYEKWKAEKGPKEAQDPLTK